MHTTWSDNNVYYDTAGCCDGGSQRISQSIGDIDLTDGWHHFAFTKDGATKTVYINGVEFLTGQNDGVLPDDFTELWVGSSLDGGESVAGLLDDFGIFNEALEQPDIQFLADGGRYGGGAPTQGFVFDPSFAIPAGASYNVEYSPDLETAFEVIATDQTGVYTDTDAGRAAAEQGFYRGVTGE